MYIISIDGNIGSGKTTLLTAIQNEYNDSVLCIKEPIDKWKPLLTKAVEYPKKYMFKLQVMILQHFKHVNEMIQQLKQKKQKQIQYIIIERNGITSLKVFAEIYHDEKIINNEQMQQLKDFYSDNKILFNYRILLDTPPSVCLQRIKQRNRKCEQSIDIDYIKQINIKHLKMYKSFNNNQYTIINGSLSKKDVYDNVINCITNMKPKMNEQKID